MSTEPQPVSPTELREKIRRPQKTQQLFTADQHSTYEERIRSLREEVHALRETEAELAEAVQREQQKNARLQHDNNELQDSIGHRETAYEELVAEYSTQTEKLEKSESEKRSFERKYDELRYAQEDMEIMQLEMQKEKKHWLKTVAEHKQTINDKQMLLDIAEAEATDYNQVADLSAANMRLTAELKELKHTTHSAEKSVREDPERTLLLARMATATTSTERDGDEWLKDLLRSLVDEANSHNGERSRLLRLMFEAGNGTEAEYQEWLADAQEAWLATHEQQSSTRGVTESHHQQEEEGPHPTNPALITNPPPPEDAPLVQTPSTPIVMNKAYYDKLPDIPDSPFSDWSAEEAAQAPVSPIPVEEERTDDIEAHQEVAQVPVSPISVTDGRPSDIEALEEVAEMPVSPVSVAEERPIAAAPSEIEAQEEVAEVPALTEPAAEQRTPDNEADLESDSEFEAPRGPGPDFPLTRRFGGPLAYLRAGRRHSQSDQVESPELGPDAPHGPLQHLFPGFRATRSGDVWEQDFGGFEAQLSTHDSLVDESTPVPEDEELPEHRVVLYTGEEASGPHSDPFKEDHVVTQAEEDAVSAKESVGSQPAEDTSSPNSDLQHGHIITQVQEEDAVPAAENGQIAINADSTPSGPTVLHPTDTPSGPIRVEIIPDDILRKYRRASFTSSASSSEDETQAARLLQLGLEWSTGNDDDAQQTEAVAAPVQRKFSWEVLPPWRWNWWNLICGIFWVLLFLHGWQWREFWTDGNDIPERNAIVRGYASYEGSWGWEIEKAKYRLIEYIGGHDMIHAVYGA